MISHGGGGANSLSSFKPLEAFTLAEVLITLGIIGVVAAMTLPAVIANKQSKELQVGLKKGYSLISQVLQMMAYEEGQAITPKDYSTHTFAPAFDKYLVAAKACPSSSCLILREEEFDEEGNSLGYNFADYKTYNKKANIEGSLLDNGQFLLRNGMTIYIENEGSIFLSIDVNGMHKGPNRWGHDLFTFQIMNNGKLLPMGAVGTTYEDASQFCSATSSSKYNGIGCTNKALTEEDYWKNLPK